MDYKDYIVEVLELNYTKIYRSGKARRRNIEFNRNTGVTNRSELMSDWGRLLPISPHLFSCFFASDGSSELYELLNISEGADEP